MPDEIVELESDNLQPNPLQPRGLITQESLEELVDSIRQHGILEPLVVAKTPAGFQIIAGERRWRASKIVGLATVPAVVKETTPNGMLEMALVENVQRVDLNPIERALAFQRLSEEFALGPSEIAKKISKSPSYVVNTIKLLNLPDALKDALSTGQTTEGHARALVSLEDPKLIIDAYKIVLQKSLSVRGAEELVRKWKVEHKIQPKSLPQETARVHNPKLEAYQEDIAKRLEGLGVEPKVKFSQSRIQGRMHIFFSGSLEKTSEIFDKIYRAIIQTS